MRKTRHIILYMYTGEAVILCLIYFVAVRRIGTVIININYKLLLLRETATGTGHRPRTRYTYVILLLLL